MFLAESGPNGYDVLIALIQTLGTLGGLLIGYLQLRKHANRAEEAAVASVKITEETAERHDVKLDDIKRDVNGNLAAEKRKSAKYRAKLEQAGINPDAD